MSSSAGIKNYTSKNPIVYVTRDIERALGMEPKDGYFVISSDSQYGREVQKKYPNNVWLIKNGGNALDTYDLLALSEVQATISKHKAHVLVFQNTARIERLCEEKGWKLLNPSADLARTVEEKISQVNWLGEDSRLLPPHQTAILKDVSYAGEKFVLQFNHSHTGQGTYIIESVKELDALKTKFPNRECRVVDFINGPVFTANVVVAEDIILGNISYQITGLSPFTDLPFSTIGNDWSLPHDQKYSKVLKDTSEIAVAVGKRLKMAGWRGLFGIDVIYEEKAKKTYLLEINARQPASTVFESKLQKQTYPGGQTMFETHVLALLGLNAKDVESKPICSGSQIVVRVTNKKHVVDLKALKEKNLAVMEYQNTAHNKELFRIQSSEGIMEAHGKLNKLGQFISSCIK